MKEFENQNIEQFCHEVHTFFIKKGTPLHKYNWMSIPYIIDDMIKRDPNTEVTIQRLDKAQIAKDWYINKISQCLTGSLCIRIEDRKLANLMIRYDDGDTCTYHENSKRRNKLDLISLRAKRNGEHMSLLTRIQEIHADYDHIQDSQHICKIILQHYTKKTVERVALEEINLADIIESILKEDPSLHHEIRQLNHLPIEKIIGWSKAQDKEWYPGNLIVEIKKKKLTGLKFKFTKKNDLEETRDYFDQDKRDCLTLRMIRCQATSRTLSFFDQIKQIELKSKTIGWETCPLSNCQPKVDDMEKFILISLPNTHGRRVFNLNAVHMLLCRLKAVPRQIRLLREQIEFIRSSLEDMDTQTQFIQKLRPLHINALERLHEIGRKDSTLISKKKVSDKVEVINHASQYGYEDPITYDNILDENVSDSTKMGMLIHAHCGALQSIIHDNKCCGCQRPIEHETDVVSVATFEFLKEITCGSRHDAEGQAAADISGHPEFDQATVTTTNVHVTIIPTFIRRLATLQKIAYLNLDMLKSKDLREAIIEHNKPIDTQFNTQLSQLDESFLFQTISDEEQRSLLFKHTLMSLQKNRFDTCFIARLKEVNKLMKSHGKETDIILSSQNPTALLDMIELSPTINLASFNRIIKNILNLIKKTKGLEKDTLESLYRLITEWLVKTENTEDPKHVTLENKVDWLVNTILKDRQVSWLNNDIVTALIDCNDIIIQGLITTQITGIISTIPSALLGKKIGQLLNPRGKVTFSEEYPLKTRLEKISSDIVETYHDEWRVITEHIEPNLKEKFLDMLFDQLCTQDHYLFGTKICHLINQLNPSEKQQASRKKYFSGGGAKSLSRSYEGEHQETINNKMILTARLALSIIPAPVGSKDIDTANFYAAYDWLQTMIETKPFFIHEQVVQALMKLHFQDGSESNLIEPLLHVLMDAEDEPTLLSITNLLLKTDLNTLEETQSEWANQFITLLSKQKTDELPRLSRLIYAMNLMMKKTAISYDNLIDIILHLITTYRLVGATALIEYFQSHLQLNDTQKIIACFQYHSTEENDNSAVMQQLAKLYIHQLFSDSGNISRFLNYLIQVHIAGDDNIFSTLFIQSLDSEQAAYVAGKLHRSINREWDMPEQNLLAIKNILTALESKKTNNKPLIVSTIEGVLESYDRLHREFEIQQRNNPMDEELYRVIFTKNTTLNDFNQLQDPRLRFAFAIRPDTKDNYVRSILPARETFLRFHSAAHAFFTAKQLMLAEIANTYQTISSDEQTQREWELSLSNYSFVNTKHSMPLLIHSRHVQTRSRCTELINPKTYKGERPTLIFNDPEEYYMPGDPRLESASNATAIETLLLEDQQIDQATYLYHLQYPSLLPKHDVVQHRPTSEEEIISRASELATIAGLITSIEANYADTKKQVSSSRFFITKTHQLCTEAMQWHRHPSYIKGRAEFHTSLAKVNLSSLQRSINQTIPLGAIGIIPLIIYNNHWVTLFIDANKKIAYLMDPSVQSSCLGFDDIDVTYKNLRSILQALTPDIKLHRFPLGFQLRQKDCGSNIIKMIGEVLNIADNHTNKSDIKSILDLLTSQYSERLRPQRLIISGNHSAPNLAYDAQHCHITSQEFKKSLCTNLYNSFVTTLDGKPFGITISLETPGVFSNKLAFYILQVENADPFKIAEEQRLERRLLEGSSEILGFWSQLLPSTQQRLLGGLLSGDNSPELDELYSLLLSRNIIIPTHRAEIDFAHKHRTTEEIRTIILDGALDDITQFSASQFQSFLSDVPESELQTRTPEMIVSLVNDYLKKEDYSCLSHIYQDRIHAHLTTIAKEWIPNAAINAYFKQPIINQSIITLSFDLDFNNKEKFISQCIKNLLSNSTSLTPIVNQLLSTEDDGAIFKNMATLLSTQIDDIINRSILDCNDYLPTALARVILRVLASPSDDLTIDHIDKELSSEIEDYLHEHNLFNIASVLTETIQPMVAPALNTVITNLIHDQLIQHINLDEYLLGDMELVVFLKQKLSSHFGYQWEKLKTCDQPLLSKDLIVLLSDHHNQNCQIINMLIETLTTQLLNDRSDLLIKALQYRSTFLIQSNQHSLIKLCGITTNTSFHHLLQIPRSNHLEDSSQASTMVATDVENFITWLETQSNTTAASEEVGVVLGPTGLRSPDSIVKILELITYSDETQIPLLSDLRRITCAVASLHALHVLMDESSLHFHASFVDSIVDFYHTLLDLLDPFVSSEALETGLIRESIRRAHQCCHQWYFARSGSYLSAFGKNYNSETSRAPLMAWIVNYLSDLLESPDSHRERLLPPYDRQSLLHDKKSSYSSQNNSLQRFTSSLQPGRIYSHIPAPPLITQHSVVQLLQSYSTTLCDALIIEFSVQYHRILSTTTLTPQHQHLLAREFWLTTRNDILSNNFFEQIQWLYDNQETLSAQFLQIPLTSLVHEENIITSIPFFTEREIISLGTLLSDTCVFNQRFVKKAFRSNNPSTFSTILSDATQSEFFFADHPDNLSLLCHAAEDLEINHIPESIEWLKPNNMLVIQNADSNSLSILHVDEWLNQVTSINTAEPICLPVLTEEGELFIENHSKVEAFIQQHKRDIQLITNLLHRLFPDKNKEFLTHQIKTVQNFNFSQQGDYKDLLTTLLIKPDSLFFTVDGSLICLEELLLVHKSAAQSFQGYCEFSRLQSEQEASPSHETFLLWLESQILSTLFPHPLGSSHSPLQKQDIDKLYQLPYAQTQIQQTTQDIKSKLLKETESMGIASFKLPGGWGSFIIIKNQTLAEIPEEQATSIPSQKACQHLISLALSYLISDTSSAQERASEKTLQPRCDDLEGFKKDILLLPTQDGKNLYYHRFRDVHNTAGNVHTIIIGASYVGSCIHGHAKQLLMAAAYWHPNLVIALEEKGIDKAYQQTYSYQRGITGTIWEGYWDGSLGFVSSAAQYGKKLLTQRHQSHEEKNQSDEVKSSFNNF